MPTDTSERGLERLICTALTGHPCDPPLGPTVGEPPAHYAGVGWGRRQLPRLRPRILRRSGPTLRLPARNPARSSRIPRLVRGQPHAPPVPSPPPRRNHQARHHRRAAPRHQARSAQPRPIPTARLPPTTQKPKSASSKTASQSPASFATAATKPSTPSTSACSSTACQSSPSS